MFMHAEAEGKTENVPSYNAEPERRNEVGMKRGMGIKLTQNDIKFSVSFSIDRDQCPPLQKIILALVTFKN